MEIIKWIIKPLIRLHKWVNRWVWPIVLLICSAVAIVLGLVKLHPQALVIGAVGVALSVINLRRAIKRLKAGKGSEDSSGSLRLRQRRITASGKNWECGKGKREWQREEPQTN